MKVYIVYKNQDMTEGRGPMILDSVWINKAKAEEYIDKQPGVMGYRRKWSLEKYGHWRVVETETQDQ